ITSHVALHSFPTHALPIYIEKLINFPEQHFLQFAFFQLQLPQLELLFGVSVLAFSVHSFFLFPVHFGYAKSSAGQDATLSLKRRSEEHTSELQSRENFVRR